MTENNDAAEPVVVMTTADVNLLPVVQSILRSAAIPFTVQGEHALGQLPVGDLGGPLSRRGLAARILVPAARADEARALLTPREEGPEGER